MIQIRYQIWYRLRNIIRRKTHFKYPLSVSKNGNVLSCIDFIEKPFSYHKEHKTFNFLSLEKPFSGWNDTKQGMLWTYNLNYMDYILQRDIRFEEAENWVKTFIKDLPNNTVGTDAYPTALRGINWIKFISIHHSSINKDEKILWDYSLYAQYLILIDKLEYHLLGNHLLEDAYSLFIGALYFRDEKMYNIASRLLEQELKEQILSDGAHYELSPMYHSILLDRLLDVYNFSSKNVFFNLQDKLNIFLKEKAEKMLGHLKSITFDDGSFPLFNDSAKDIAPTSTDIFEYAHRLNLSWEKIKMKECGYRKLKNDVFEAIVDVCNIKADYQPGHTHADTFSYELRVNGVEFIVDTGISTYEKNARRQYERGSSAHNTVTVNEQNSSDVWGGFRVGKRAKVKIEKDETNDISAIHNGYKNVNIKRNFILSNSCFMIKDEILGNNDFLAVNHIFLSPNENIEYMDKNMIITSHCIIKIKDCIELNIEKQNIAITYNNMKEANAIKMLFRRSMSYTIFEKK